MIVYSDIPRNYFGESVALYWSFAETYTRFLTLVAALGATEFFCEYHGINYIYSNLLFGLFNLVCLAVFFEVYRVSFFPSPPPPPPPGVEEEGKRPQFLLGNLWQA